MSLRLLVVLAAVLSIAPLTVLAAQEPAPIAVTAPPAGPRIAQPLARVEPSLSSSRAPRSMYRTSDQHTIVVSTLVLVLAVVILVLLIA